MRWPYGLPQCTSSMATVAGRVVALSALRHSPGDRHPLSVSHHTQHQVSPPGPRLLRGLFAVCSLVNIHEWKRKPCPPSLDTLPLRISSFTLLTHLQNHQEMLGPLTNMPFAQMLGKAVIHQDDNEVNKYVFHPLCVWEDINTLDQARRICLTR